MHYITERAVFELRPEGLVLTELAEGIDLKTQVLDLMEFKPVVSRDLRVIPSCIYQEDGPFGLKAMLT